MRRDVPGLSGSHHGRHTRHPQRRVISRPAPQAWGRGGRHKHSRQREKRGRRNPSHNCQTKPTHRLTVPKATRLPGVKHSPVASGSRLQLPGGRVADGAASFPKCSTTTSLSLLSSLLLLLYPASPSRAKGRVREEPQAFSVLRQTLGEGRGGEPGENGRTEGRGEGRGG